jgi:hypothetical protein
MLLAEAEPSGETGNDSDGDGIPYVAGGQVATVFAAEAEYTFTITSARDLIKNEAALSVYPNPVKGNATISFENVDLKNASISVINIAGQKVQVIDANRNRSIQWNTSELNNGIYFVRLESDGAPFAVKKVIVNK